MVLALLLAAVSTGCQRTVERKAEDMVNAVLPNYIGPAVEWKTRIHGDSTLAVMKGRLRRVEITGKGVQVEKNLTLEDLSLQFDEVEVDTRARRLKNVGRATFQIRVRDVVLDRYARLTRSDINGLQIRFDNGEIVVDAKPDVKGIIEVPVSVSGSLVPRGDPVLSFQPDSAKLTIIPVPRVVIDYLVGKLNPTIDLSHLMIPLRFQRAEVVGNFLVLSGSIKPDDVLRLSQ
ncbi:MAG: hypothetical protein OHK0029_29560 [Armatimonadaceae bacterium]